MTATATEHNNKSNVKISQQQNEDYEKLIEKFDSEGIEKSVQKVLLDKLEAGELWDSLKGDSIPIKEEKGTDLDGSPYIKKTFEDGSIIKVLDYSMNNRQVNVNYGTVISSSLYHTEYKGGKVGVDLMLVNFGMKVDWTWNNYNKSVIKSVYSPWATNLSSKGDITIAVQPNTSTKKNASKSKSTFRTNCISSYNSIFKIKFNISWTS